MHSEELSPITDPRKRRKRRAGSTPRKKGRFATGLYKFAKYALLMWAIATAIFLVLRTSMDFALEQSSDDIARAIAAPQPTPEVSDAEPAQETNTAENLQPPALRKAQTIADSIDYEVIAYAAKLWHALDGESQMDLELQRGSKVEAIDVNGKWLHVRTESGLTGFVHESMLRKLVR